MNQSEIVIPFEELDREKREALLDYYLMRFLEHISIAKAHIKREAESMHEEILASGWWIMENELLGLEKLT